MWESHTEPSVRRVSRPTPEPGSQAYMIKKPEYEDKPVRTVTVNRPESSVDQSKELLKKLLAILTPAVPAPARGAGAVVNGQVSSTTGRETREKHTGPSGPSGAGRADEVGNDAPNVFRGETVAKSAVPTPTGRT